MAPTVVLRPAPRSSTIRIGSRDEVVPVSRLKACMATDTTADCWACAQAILPQPSGCCFQTRWFLRLLLHRRRHGTVLELFSYPARRFLHTQDQRRLHSLHKHGTCPISKHRPKGWTSDLFSSQRRPELRGSLVQICLCPWSRSNQSGIL
jgi:hypothetical protein